MSTCEIITSNGLYVNSLHGTYNPHCAIMIDNPIDLNKLLLPQEFKAYNTMPFFS